MYIISTENVCTNLKMFVQLKNKGVFFKTDSLGDISIIGGASGTRNAAASILRDLVLVKSLE